METDETLVHSTEKSVRGTKKRSDVREVQASAARSDRYVKVGVTSWLVLHFFWVLRFKPGSDLRVESWSGIFFGIKNWEREKKASERCIADLQKELMVVLHWSTNQRAPFPWWWVWGVRCVTVGAHVVIILGRLSSPRLNVSAHDFNGRHVLTDALQPGAFIIYIYIYIYILYMLRRAAC